VIERSRIRCVASITKSSRSRSSFPLISPPYRPCSESTPKATWRDSSAMMREVMSWISGSLAIISFIMPKAARASPSMRICMPR
jgi:hypothetical protein